MKIRQQGYHDSYERINHNVLKSRANQGLFVDLDPENAKYLFAPNLNIETIVTIDKEERERSLAGRTDIVDR